MATPLATPVQYVKGVGPRISEMLGRCGIATVEQLLFHLPARYIDRREISTVSQLTIGRDRTTVARVISQGPRIIGKGRRVYEVLFSDGTGTITGRWFRFNPRFMSKRFEEGKDYLLAGDVGFFGRGRYMIGGSAPVPPKSCDAPLWQSQSSRASFNQPHSGGEGGRSSDSANSTSLRRAPAKLGLDTALPGGGATRALVMIHPELEVYSSGEEDSSMIAGRILPIYPSTEGLGQRVLRKIMKNAWEKFGHEVTDTLPVALREQFRIAPLRLALSCLHFPPANFDVADLNNHSNEMHQSIVFEESFSFFIGLALRGLAFEHRTGIPFPASSPLVEKGRGILPFRLTGDQERVLGEISQDLARPIPMHRLLQGDVGCGKTVVSLLAALQVVGHGHQVALMAPTELLALQHLQSFRRVLDDLRIPVALLTSQVKGRERKGIYAALASGELPIVVGTHAIIQDEVVFARLGMVVIDEQHRFGVLQRQDLMQKGMNPHLLVMTATPIPRTLAMTVYGDLAVSVIREMPPGRRPVVTKVYRESQRDKLYHGMEMELAKGHQIYVVYPLIEESEKMDLKNATDMALALKQVFEPRFKVALLHGRMKGEEKHRVMQEFKLGNVGILVSTSVVEVGVDVPNATVMVIEHAERFGLSQLHQLRGRIGRSTMQSYCILLDHGVPGSTATDRLSILERSTDGFEIAEADLEIRGPGEFLGTRQSGLPDLQVANIARDGDILSRAKEAAFALVAQDPDFSRPENSPVRDTVFRRWHQKLALGDVA